MRRQKRLERPGYAFLAVAATSLPLLAAIPAFADLSLVEERTLTGDPNLGGRDTPYTVTLSFKGEKCREEIQGSSIVHIYDIEKDRYYTLNRINRTYSVRTLDDVITAGGFRPLASLKLVGTASIAEGGSMRTIEKHAASDYTIDSKVTLSDDKRGTTILTGKMDGQQWTTSEVTLPSKSPNAVRFAYNLAPRAGRLFQPFYGKLREIKGLPMDATYSFTLSGAINGTFEVEVAIKSISEATLPDYMFNVPATYEEVDSVE